MKKMKKIAPEHRDIVAINYAFILSIQLMLHSVETHVYFDSPKMTNPALHLSDENQCSHAKLLATLYENFSDLDTSNNKSLPPSAYHLGQRSGPVVKKSFIQKRVLIIIKGAQRYG
ncbi:MAG: hypothetical protein ACYSP9_07695 [Planctomycetota bacterium]|jgi:hypothetical protein